MTKLRKRQLLFLGVLGLAIILYILAKTFVMHLLYWVFGIVLLFVWAHGLYQTCNGKDPIAFWIEEDTKHKYE